MTWVGNESKESTEKRSASSALPASPPLSSRRVVLRPILQRDYDYLYNLFARPELTFLWRFRGTTPPPEQFIGLLWNGVLCQFMICRRSNLEPVGLITAYNADLRSGYAYLALVVAPEVAGSLIAHDANLLFINYLFHGWQLRKLYGETSERHVDRLFPSSIGKLVTIEGRLLDHEFFANQYWDGILVALYRDVWEGIIAARLPRILNDSSDKPESSGRVI